MMDFIPEAHTLLMVVAGVLSGKPEKRSCSLIASREESVKTPIPHSQFQKVSVQLDVVLLSPPPAPHTFRFAFSDLASALNM